MNELQEMINKAHDSELALKTGMVYQVWEDGEITLQKSGDLLWQRTLHSMKQGIAKVDDIIWPLHTGKYGYAFVSNHDAYKIRERIGEIAILEIQVKMKC